jgi:serine/threonine protein kinase
MELGLSDWNEEIKRRAKKKNYYTEKEIIDILKQLTDALLYLEIQGIAHRDIKPQNILIFENNVFKLTDFGEAKNLSDTSQQATLRGSELYMSPMLYNGLKYNQRDVMHNPYKSDVYSLGLCFIYALSLNLNILNDLREVINMKVVKSIISRALKKNYSMKIIELISKMLELNERIRYSFEDIDKYVSENYNSV